MRAVRLLREAISKKPDDVLDIAAGPGSHAICFIANGSTVAGVELTPAGIEHDKYQHIQMSYEDINFEKTKFDLVWSCHTLEHIPNAQDFLIKLREWLKDDGWLAIAVPPQHQDRLHIGHFSLWTPAHLVYNLICAGWDCREAKWYTEYNTIGLIVQKTNDIDFQGMTGLPSEVAWLNQYSPRLIKQNDGAWWGNNWHEEVSTARIPDPAAVTIGLTRTNLPPEVQLAFGPNPELRKGYERV